MEKIKGVIDKGSPAVVNRGKKLIQRLKNQSD
jgi:hypothetical protein